MALDSEYSLTAGPLARSVDFVQLTQQRDFTFQHNMRNSLLVNSEHLLNANVFKIAAQATTRSLAAGEGMICDFAI